MYRLERMRTRKGHNHAGHDALTEEIKLFVTYFKIQWCCVSFDVQLISIMFLAKLNLLMKVIFNIENYKLFMLTIA